MVNKNKSVFRCIQLQFVTKTMNILIIFLIFLVKTLNCMASETGGDDNKFPWEMVQEYAIKYKSIRSVSVALCDTKNSRSRSRTSSKTTIINNRMEGMRTTMSLPLYNRNGYRNNNNNNSTSEQYHFTKDILIKIVPIEEGAQEQSLDVGTTKYETIEGRSNRNKVYSSSNITIATTAMTRMKRNPGAAVFEKIAETTTTTTTTMENKLVKNLFGGTTLQRRQLIVLDMSCGNNSLLILDIVSQLFSFFFVNFL